MCNGFKSVSYHFNNYYCSLSEAVTVAKNKYPKLVPSNWHITPITRSDYVKITNSNAYEIEKKLMDLEERSIKQKEIRRRKHGKNIKQS
jgi:hypothetical protein